MVIWQLMSKGAPRRPWPAALWDCRTQHVSGGSISAWSPVPVGSALSWSVRDLGRIPGGEGFGGIVCGACTQTVEPLGWDKRWADYVASRRMTGGICSLYAEILGVGESCLNLWCTEWGTGRGYAWVGEECYGNSHNSRGWKFVTSSSRKVISLPTGVTDKV